MSIGSDIAALFAEVAQEQHKTLAPLSDELGLLETGLDSLCFAIIVARLEDRLGLDPFSADEEVDFPVTVGDFTRLYEHAASTAAR
jgi:acyl carrier protein